MIQSADCNTNPFRLPLDRPVSWTGINVRASVPFRFSDLGSPEQNALFPVDQRARIEPNETNRCRSCTVHCDTFA